MCGVAALLCKDPIVHVYIYPLPGKTNKLDSKVNYMSIS